MTTTPRILIGCPTHELKSDSRRVFMRGLADLTYPSFDVLLEDNSPTPRYSELLRADASEWMNRHPGKKFEIIYSGEISTKARERIVHGRNLIRKKVLDEKYDYFLSLEQDVVPPADIIQTLLSQKKEIISATYLNRKTTPTGARLEIMAGKYFNAEEKEKGIFRDVGFNDILPSRVMEVDYTGVGCMLISHSALEKIPFRYDANVPHFDDMLFCMDAQRAGKQIYLDSSAWCRHYFNEAFLKTEK